MSSVALEPRLFRDRASPLSRVWTSRTASLLILFALAIVVVAPGMTHGRLFPRPTPYVATMQYAIERLRGGELPQWNPHERFGEPIARDGRAALWYPATLVHLLFPQGQAWHAIAILHAWLAGLAAWMLAGRYGLEPVPRLMTGAGYMLCGMIVLGLESAQANVLVWLPWAALAVERLSERVTARRILLASLVLTVQFLGGDLLASAALVITCTLALLIRAFWIGPKRWLAAMVAAALALIVAVAASAVQWLAIMYPWRGKPLSALCELPRAWPWGAGTLLSGATSPALLGAIPLTLAVIAVLSGRRPRAVVLWAAIGATLTLAVVVLDVWGQSLRSLPHPHVLAAGVCLAVAVLAGFGVETVAALAAERAARLRAKLFLAAGAIAAMAVLVTTALIHHDLGGSREPVLHGARMLVAAAMVCAAALIVRSHELPQWRSRGWSWVALACAELLAFALPAMRGVPIGQLTNASDVAAFFRSRREEAGRFLEASGLLPGTFATWQGLEDAGGAGRGSPRHEAWSTAAFAAGGRNGSDVLRVGNVRYLIAHTQAPAPPPPWRAAQRSGSLTIYADPDPFPRAWLAPQGRRVASATQALEPLVSGQRLDPRQVVLLDDAGLDPADRVLMAQSPDYWTRPAGAGGAGEANYHSVSPEEVRIRLPRGGGWLVVSDAFAAGWRATVDGRREPIVAAFGAVRAVQVPPGAAEVILHYAPPEWHYALLTTAAGGGMMLLLLAWSLLRPGRESAALALRVP
ncbi:MAG TPA: hypothetical protein VGR35_01590 [Tepidisphaeraceae bacterium]|nr:hypothetical protein [Tepidisphaeraceae bacterium]